MIIFFRNISEQTKDHHLAAFIEPVIKGSWFRKKIIVEDLKVIHLYNRHSKTSEFHGLVTLQPESAGRRLIKRLSKKPLLGRPIIVREYHRRVWQNDPRIKYDFHHSATVCQRVADRRRKNLEVVRDVAIKFSGDTSFHRRGV